jgi:hypothetical protein
MKKQTQRELVADLMAVSECSKLAANYLKASGQGVATLHSISEELIRLGGKIEKLIERSVKEEESRPNVEKENVGVSVAAPSVHAAVLYNDSNSDPFLIH